MKGNNDNNKIPDASKNIRVPKLVFKYILLLLIILGFSESNLLSLNDACDKRKYEHILELSTVPRTYFVLTIDGVLWSINNNGRILWKRKVLNGGTFYPNKISIDKENLHPLSQNRLYCSFQGNIFYGSTIDDNKNFYDEYKGEYNSNFSNKSIIPRGIIPINNVSIGDLVERCPFHSSLFPGLYLTGSRNSDILTIDLLTGKIISNSASSQKCEIYNDESVLESNIRSSVAIGITSWKIMAMNILTNRIEWNIRYSDISGLNNNNKLNMKNLLNTNKISISEYKSNIYFGSSRNSLYLSSTSIDFDSIISKVFVLKEGISLPYIPSSFFYIEQIEVERYPDYSNSAVGPLINMNNILLNEFTHYLPGKDYSEIGYLIGKKLIELSPVVVDVKKIMSQPLLPLPLYHNNNINDMENLRNDYLNNTNKISIISAYVNKNYLVLITGMLLFVINLVFIFILFVKKRNNSKRVIRNSENIKDMKIEKFKDDLRNSFLASYSNFKSDDVDNKSPYTHNDDKHIRISKSHSMIDMRTNFLGFSKDAFFKAINYKTGKMDKFGDRNILDEDVKNLDMISNLRLPEYPNSSITTNTGAYSQRISMQTSISTANTPKNNTLICSTPVSISSGPKSSSLYNIPQKCELARCIDNGRFSKNFEICKLIGSGGFGQVYQVEHKLERGTYYAIKFLRLGIGANDDITRIRYFREITANRTTLSKHVVRYYTWWCEEPEALQNYVDGIDSLGCSKSTSHSSIQPMVVDNKKTRKKNKNNKNLKFSEKDLNKNTCKLTNSDSKSKILNKGKILNNDTLDDSNSPSCNGFKNNSLDFYDNNSADSCLSRAPFDEESNIDEKYPDIQNDNDDDNLVNNASNERCGAISLASNSSIDDYDSQDLNFIAFENESDSIDFSSNELNLSSKKEENEEIQDNGLLYRTRTMTPSINSGINNDLLPFSSSKYDQNSQNILLTQSGISSMDKNSHNHHRSLVYLSPGNRKDDEPIYEVIMMIQMELCVGVTLRSWLGDSCRSTEFGGTDVELNMFKQIMKGIRDIHEKGIVHRDLKPENIFVNPNTLQIKIGDFGLARLMFDGETNETKINNDIISPKINNKGVNNELNRFMEDNKRKKVENTLSRLDSQMSVRGQVIGTPGYTAPEGGALCNEKADIYSAALILLELLCPRFTTAMERIHILDNFRSKGIVPTCIVKNHDSWIPLLRSMTYRDPEFRPSAENTYRIVKDLIKKCVQK